MSEATDRYCAACDRRLGADHYLGTPRRYCGNACRQRAFQRRFRHRTGLRYATARRLGLQP